MLSRCVAWEMAPSQSVELTSLAGAPRATVRCPSDACLAAVHVRGPLFSVWPPSPAGVPVNLIGKESSLALMQPAAA